MNIRRNISGALVALTVGMLLPLGVQAAGENKAEAQKHYDQGNAHYNLQEWDAAIAEFKAAYMLENRPQFLWAIAQSHRLKGDCESAIKSYRAFIRTSPPADKVANAEARISDCERTLADAPKTPPAGKGKKLAAEAEPSAAEPPPPPPPSAAPPAPPAPVSASAAPVAPPPSEPRAPEKGGAWYGDVLGHSLFWVGLVGAGVGGAMLVSANGEMKDAAHASDYDSWRSETDRAPGRQTIGVVGLAAGGALMGLGVLRFVMVAGRDRPSEPTVGLTIGPRSAGFVGVF